MYPLLHQCQNVSPCHSRLLQWLLKLNRSMKWCHENFSLTLAWSGFFWAENLNQRTLRIRQGRGQNCPIAILAYDCRENRPNLKLNLSMNIDALKRFISGLWNSCFSLVVLSSWEEEPTWRFIVACGRFSALYKKISIQKWFSGLNHFQELQRMVTHPAELFGNDVAYVFSLQGCKLNSSLSYVKLWVVDMNQIFADYLKWPSEN